MRATACSDLTFCTTAPGGSPLRPSELQLPVNVSGLRLRRRDTRLLRHLLRRRVWLLLLGERPTPDSVMHLSCRAVQQMLHRRRFCLVLCAMRAQVQQL